jgi:hypothetical protein
MSTLPSNDDNDDIIIIINAIKTLGVFSQCGKIKLKERDL